MTASEFDQMDEAEIINLISHVCILVEVEPAQKETPTPTSGVQKYSVYLGDGINDVPGSSGWRTRAYQRNRSGQRGAADFILLNRIYQ